MASGGESFCNDQHIWSKRNSLRQHHELHISLFLNLPLSTTYYYVRPFWKIAAVGDVGAIWGSEWEGERDG